MNRWDQVPEALMNYKFDIKNKNSILGNTLSLVNETSQFVRWNNTKKFEAQFKMIKDGFEPVIVVLQYRHSFTCDGVTHLEYPFLRRLKQLLL